MAGGSALILHSASRGGDQVEELAGTQPVQSVAGRVKSGCQPRHEANALTGGTGIDQQRRIEAVAQPGCGRHGIRGGITIPSQRDGGLAIGNQYQQRLQIRISQASLSDHLSGLVQTGRQRRPATDGQSLQGPADQRDAGGRCDQQLGPLVTKGDQAHLIALQISLPGQRQGRPQGRGHLFFRPVPHGIRTVEEKHHQATGHLFPNLAVQVTEPELQRLAPLSLFDMARQCRGKGRTEIDRCTRPTGAQGNSPDPSPPPVSAPGPAPASRSRDPVSAPGGGQEAEVDRFVGGEVAFRAFFFR